MNTEYEPINECTYIINLSVYFLYYSVYGITAGMVHRHYKPGMRKAMQAICQEFLDSPIKMALF